MKNKMTRADNKESEFKISPAEVGERLDIFLSKKGVFATRSQVKRAIGEGQVQVNGVEPKPACRLKTGDVVIVRREEPKEYNLAPEEIPLDIIYEDSHILVVNKPHGMVVHPAAGNRSGTLVNALLFHCRDLSGIGGV
ncbi:MAG: RluA family pseudouridine synthase, partial [Syntrophobacterales bacterium]|nr:RluA family pseudouridine synthase [Syntrophobacterales bacterium]